MPNKSGPRPGPKSKNAAGGQRPDSKFKSGQTRPRRSPESRTSAPEAKPSPAPEKKPERELPIPLEPDYVIVAQIVTTFGLRGAVKADIRTDFPERFNEMTEAWLRPPGAAPGSPLECRKIASARIQSDKQVTIKFEGISKPEQAEALRGYTILVPRTEVVPLQEGEYYIFQLIGLDVYSEDGVFVGRVAKLLEYPANDVYEVIGPLSPKPVLIPAVKDIVKSIDLEQKRIIIELREGLI